MSDERERVDTGETEKVEDADFEGHRMDLGRVDEGQVDVGKLDDDQIDVGKLDDDQIDVG